MRLTLLPILLTLAVTAPAFADGVPVKDGPAAAELICEYAPLRPGRSVTVAVVIHLDEGWHAYWTNPGDAGQPPEVTWTLPDGYEVGLVEWPAPHRLVEGPIVSFVYSDRLVLPVSLYVPEDAAEGEATIRATVAWVVCKDQCLPGKVDVSLTRPVKPGTTKVDARAHRIISATRDRLPVPLDAEASVSGRRVGLTPAPLPKETPADFFPEAEGVFDLAASPGLWTMDELGVYTTHLQLVDGAEVPERLVGVLVTDKKAYAINAAVERKASSATTGADDDGGSGLSAIGIMLITAAGVVLLLLMAMLLLRSGRRNQT